MRDGRPSLQQSNDKVAAQLVCAGPASYARAHLWEQGTERGGEWLRQGLGPNNNNIHTNKNNWAAFVRPIFLRGASPTNRQQTGRAQEPA